MQSEPRRGRAACGYLRLGAGLRVKVPREVEAFNGRGRHPVRMPSTCGVLVEDAWARAAMH